jgi:lipopolysaccharide transport system ATP-binding protein
MDDSVVIRAEGLGKKYVIGHQAERERYVALRDVIARGARNFGRVAMDMMRGRPIVVGDNTEEFWALRHVDFEVRRGEVIGIIGRNGAGKSTLLKILSRITDPSEGQVTISGRVVSLLEVGTGFHSELSGRENVYLNGAILGMTRAEIRRKFDEIVAFAEVERFLDTPVKRYSSGMYVRLAFAVAAHLEPEILVVDEVLAVGDSEFRKKSLGKMQDVAGQGRTVLFVSHNIGAINNLCNRAFLLEGGRLRMAGPTRDVTERYFHSIVRAVEQPIQSFDNVTSLLSLATVGADGENKSSFQIGEPIGIRCEFDVNTTGHNPQPTFILQTAEGLQLFYAVNDNGFRRPGRYQSTAWLTPSYLNEGPYTITFSLSTHTPLATHVQTELGFEVVGNAEDGTHAEFRSKFFRGVARFPIRWQDESRSGAEQPSLSAEH